MNKLYNCHDCGAAPGEIHEDGCDTARCSVCGDQGLAAIAKGMIKDSQDGLVFGPVKQKPLI